MRSPARRGRACLPQMRARLRSFLRRSGHERGAQAARARGRPCVGARRWGSRAERATRGRKMHAALTIWAEARGRAVPWGPRSVPCSS
jgi:hypothetical protein